MKKLSELLNEPKSTQIDEAHYELPIITTDDISDETLRAQAIDYLYDMKPKANLIVVYTQTGIQCMQRYGGIHQAFLANRMGFEVVSAGYESGENEDDGGFIDRPFLNGMQTVNSRIGEEVMPEVMVSEANKQLTYGEAKKLAKGKGKEWAKAIGGKATPDADYFLGFMVGQTGLNAYSYLENIKNATPELKAKYRDAWNKMIEMQAKVDAKKAELQKEIDMLGEDVTEALIIESDHTFDVYYKGKKVDSLNNDELDGFMTEPKNVKKYRVIKIVRNDGNEVNYASNGKEFVVTGRKKGEEAISEAFDTDKAKMNALKKKGKIITFKDKFMPEPNENSDAKMNIGSRKLSQVIVDRLEKNGKAVKIIGMNWNTPEFKDMDALIDAVNWDFMRGAKKFSSNLGEAKKERFFMGDINETGATGIAFDIIKKIIEIDGSVNDKMVDALNNAHPATLKSAKKWFDRVTGKGRFDSQDFGHLIDMVESVEELEEARMTYTPSGNSKESAKNKAKSAERRYDMPEKDAIKLAKKLPQTFKPLNSKKERDIVNQLKDGGWWVSNVGGEYQLRHYDDKNKSIKLSEGNTMLKMSEVAKLNEAKAMSGGDLFKAMIDGEISYEEGEPHNKKTRTFIVKDKSHPFNGTKVVVSLRDAAKLDRVAEQNRMLQVEQLEEAKGSHRQSKTGREIGDLVGVKGGPLDGSTGTIIDFKGDAKKSYKIKFKTAKGEKEVIIPDNHLEFYKSNIDQLAKDYGLNEGKDKDDDPNVSDTDAEYDALVKSELDKLAKKGKNLGNMSDQETKDFWNMIDKKHVSDEEEGITEKSNDRYFNNVVKRTLGDYAEKITSAKNDREERFYLNRYEVQLADFADAMGISTKELKKMLGEAKEYGSTNEKYFWLTVLPGLKNLRDSGLDVARANRAKIEAVLNRYRNGVKEAGEKYGIASKDIKEILKYVTEECSKHKAMAEEDCEDCSVEEKCEKHLEEGVKGAKFKKGDRVKNYMTKKVAKVKRVYDNTSKGYEVSGGVRYELDDGSVHSGATLSLAEGGNYRDSSTLGEEGKKHSGGQKAYQAFLAKELKKAGYDSIEDIPDDKKDDFFNSIDSKWESDDEADGIEEAFKKGDSVKIKTKNNKDDYKRSFDGKVGVVGSVGKGKGREGYYTIDADKDGETFKVVLTDADLIKEMTVENDLRDMIEEARKSSGQKEAHELIDEFMAKKESGKYSDAEIKKMAKEYKKKVFDTVMAAESVKGMTAMDMIKSKRK